MHWAFRIGKPERQALFGCFRDLEKVAAIVDEGQKSVHQVEKKLTSVGRRHKLSRRRNSVAMSFRRRPEIWRQLRYEAGDRQVAGELDVGLTHNVGGTGQTCVVHIFERR